MATALDVAAYILEISGPMTAMKLQKLAYYSQAWNLVWRDRPLFEDAIEAWAAGPVVRSLYKAHRGMYTLKDGTQVGGDTGKLSEDEKRSIRTVVSHYGKWSAEELSDLTHKERPWLVAREGLAPTERGDRVIDPAEMMDYYGSLARQKRAQQASQ